MIVLQGARACVEVLQFSPDGRGLAAPLEGVLQVWEDITAGGAPVCFPHAWVRQARFTPDGLTLLLGGQGAAVIDLLTRESTPIVLERQMPAFFDLTPDGRAVVFVQHDTRLP